MTRNDDADAFRSGRGWRVTGRTVLFAMLGFFGIVFFANGMMMWMASKTFDGLDEPDAYRRGVHYNERLREAREQRLLGWHFTLEVPPVGSDDPHERLVKVRARDREGRPLARLGVKASFRSPVNAHEDRPVVLAPDPRAPGLYRARVRLPRIGKWQFALEAEDAAGHRWRGIFDLYLKPGRARS